MVGVRDGFAVGFCDGSLVGASVGRVGTSDGCSEGVLVGSPVASVGSAGGIGVFQNDKIVVGWVLSRILGDICLCWLLRPMSDGT